MACNIATCHTPYVHACMRMLVCAGDVKKWGEYVGFLISKMMSLNPVAYARKINDNPMNPRLKKTIAVASMNVNDAAVLIHHPHTC